MYMLPTDAHFRCEDAHRLNMKGWEKVSCEWKPKESGGSDTHTSDKMDFTTKTMA